ncbi:amidase domain-containing protein [Clostridium intestinale]|uniref:Amidase domain-containing protein n=1 Tax=Clostridium intestinale TaxID=36845 RepID=A0A7D6ZZA7_9CLOT|nr:amidase domain-containing protein [Clostridium intestinale]QLY81054.1 amidase domain-containing protein [Clostridium intestinale]
MKELNRNKMIDYAYKYALIPNDKYAYLGSKSTGGNDCSNFISQIIHFAGAPMRYISPYWYYKSDRDYSVSWSTAHSLFWLLRENLEYLHQGPKGVIINDDSIEIGDLVFFQHKNGHVFHSAIITSFTAKREPLITQHSIDAINKKINPEYFLLNIYFMRIYI